MRADIETNEFRSGVGARWPFLSDPGRKLQKDLDIAEYTDPQHNPMIPHTLVLEPGLRVYKVYSGKTDLIRTVRCTPRAMSISRAMQTPS
jgi:hypothetical protein